MRMSHLRLLARCSAVAALAYFASSAAHAQTAAPQPAYGSYNVHVLAGGMGLEKPLREHDPLAEAPTGWSLSLWVNGETAGATTLLAGLGSPNDLSPRFLGLRAGRPIFWSGAGHELVAPASLPDSGWHSLAIAIGTDTSAHLYVDGAEVAEGKLPVGPSAATLEFAPSGMPSAEFHHFSGRLALVSLTSNGAASGLPSSASEELKRPPVDLDVLNFEEASKPWPVQTRGQAGLDAPQNPVTLPHSRAPFSKPIAKPVPEGADTLSSDRTTLTLEHSWRLAEASTVSASPAAISTAVFDAASWYAATVPGTVLTTLIDRGVYPDPNFGLNNLAIPEHLSRQSFWYRTTFNPPAALRGRRLTLNFAGINYHATVWVNGHSVGEIKGAFIAGLFDVTGLVHLGEPNAVAVLIEPPPHPGIAHEQSIAGGPGDNGGIMALDGPTFAATEGWDWIPGIRDRNIGLWQPVTLRASGAVTIDSPRIDTTLPLPDTSRADITVTVPLRNATSAAIRGELELSFDEVHVRTSVTVPPGGIDVPLRPAIFPQLTVQHPRLWWPKGYGVPDLHTMHLRFNRGREVSDTRETRFGIREITYELSLFDSTGHLRRVEVSPSVAALSGKAVVDQRHEALLETPDGWVASLLPGAESTPAVRPLNDPQSKTSLIVRVNGVRIACKGGNWGMDDMLKRVSREHLEPYFRLHKEANLNMIRNWMGQNTEETFFDLADEYGLLVWNDFWDSTQNYNLEPNDTALFLANARDTIIRFRNHPSIAVWCGRNEGVPSPVINEGLAKLITELDGTRYYSASSNRVNLHNSGPYRAQEPVSYFTKLASGFAVEIGLPSPPTMEAFQAFLPVEDQWPISDAWAYHDWHQSGNGDVAPFMDAMVEEFGAPSSLADFDRKAQMLAYEAHRAVFEGFSAHLWAPNGGRLLWMTQPAWPSTVWQIFSHDYDTAGAFFGVKKASEPVHVQMNLPNHTIAVVNNTTEGRANLAVHVHIFDLQGKLLFAKDVSVAAAPNAITTAMPLDLSTELQDDRVALVDLSLDDAAGGRLSNNFYWVAAEKSALRALDDLPPASIAAEITLTEGAGDHHVRVTLHNTGATPAIEIKLTLLNGTNGARILPAFFDDNYISLMPDEVRTVTIAFPGSLTDGIRLGMRGWNVTARQVAPAAHVTARE